MVEFNEPTLELTLFTCPQAGRAEQYCKQRAK